MLLEAAIFGAIAGFYLEGLLRSCIGACDIASPRSPVLGDWIDCLAKPVPVTTAEVCAICLDPPTDTRVLLCGHEFCRRCIRQWIARTPRCPLCNREFCVVAIEMEALMV